ncbi:MAG: hypothetical protein KC609_07025, partial [Myxococcales bacterium]|nr:hypothetical protein [Myxococcales bacterium]
MNGSSLMKHLVAAILLLYSASPSATAPRPQAQRFRFQFTESWNRHHIFGADGRRAKSTVELSLERSGAASLRDEGYRGSSTLSRRWGYKSDRRDWSLSWTGRWRLEKGKLLVVLRRTNLRCSETRRRQGAAKRRAPCKPSPTTL